jgi:Flp pilus assembly protein TadD
MCEQRLRAQLSRSGIAGLLCVVLVCVVLAACGSTAQFATETSLSPESQRLIQLGGDVEARGDYDTAAALYMRAAERSDNAAEAHLRLGTAYLKVGNYPGARDAFAKVLTTNPKDPDALLGLGTAQLRSGDIESSARTLAMAGPLINTPSAYNRLGAAQILAGRFDAAREAFERAHALAPNDPDIAVNIALAKALLGKTDEAVSAMQAVVQLPVAQPRHRANLVMVLGIAGRVDDAKAVDVPGMSPTQKRDMLARAKRVRDATNPLAKARAIGLFSTGGAGQQQT